MSRSDHYAADASVHKTRCDDKLALALLFGAELVA